MSVYPTVGSRVSRGKAFPITQAKDVIGGEVGKETGTRTIRVDFTPDSYAWAVHVPQIGTPHPGADWLKFSAYELRQINGTQADLVLTYKQDEFPSWNTDPGLPDDEVTEDGSTERIPITSFPGFHTVPDGETLSMADYYDWGAGRIYHGATLPTTWVDASGKEVPCPNAGAAVPASIRGMEAYLVGTGTVTVVEYSYNEPTNPIPLSATLAVPTGYSGDGHWIILSGTRRRQGAYWQRVLTYQYSAKEFPDFVYEESTP